MTRDIQEAGREGVVLTGRFYVDNAGMKVTATFIALDDSSLLAHWFLLLSLTDTFTLHSY